jgi:spore coat polysaccharide biosynthesis protein SpsF (cytidylyltransferase family)
MLSVTLDERQIKDLFKQAVLELFQERRDLLYDLLVEVIEDFALANAIKEGESTETVSRAEVFRILEGAN